MLWMWRWKRLKWFHVIDFCNDSEFWLLFEVQTFTEIIIQTVVIQRIANNPKIVPINYRVTHHKSHCNALNLSNAVSQRQLQPPTVSSIFYVSLLLLWGEVNWCQFIYVWCTVLPPAYATWCTLTNNEEEFW